MLLGWEGIILLSYLYKFIMFVCKIRLFLLSVNILLVNLKWCMVDVWVKTVFEGFSELVKRLCKEERIWKLKRYR